MAKQVAVDANIEELKGLAPDIAQRLSSRDAFATLPTQLSSRWPEGHLTSDAKRVWELCGLHFLGRHRFHEALAVFSALYDRLLASQVDGRVHKGMPLVWMSDCFFRLNFPVHGKRFLMLSAVEDAISDGGVISPDTTGAYFRLAWLRGVPSGQIERYAREFLSLSGNFPDERPFPEAMLQRVDDRWLTELPSSSEVFSYRANGYYIHYLLSKVGDGTGEALEQLAQYLMSCMPGCRAKRHAKTHSTDFDVVCSMEGADIDFRSELGRYFVCECKDWSGPADFSVMAKFCRVLDSTKSKFGVLFSKHGISGADGTRDAGREQQKVFQDRGIVIVGLDLSDLKSVAEGANLTTLLRERYEAVRLDLAPAGQAEMRNRGGKYDKLRGYLAEQSSSGWRTTFGEIERVLSSELPASARRHQAWWGNDKRHVQARAWLQAGWKTTDLDLSSEKVTFVKA